MRRVFWGLPWGCSLLVLCVLATASHATLPREAARYRQHFVREIHYFWGLAPSEALFFAQVHQESGWNPAAQSPSASGLAQVTPGTARLIQSRFGSAFLGLCERPAGCPLEPRWALRALLLWDRALYQARDFAHGEERLAFMLADYNGGAGWIDHERAWCAAHTGCDPTRYFGHVRCACGQSRPGRASWACRENGQYPVRILYELTPRYQQWLR